MGCSAAPTPSGQVGAARHINTNYKNCGGKFDIFNSRGSQCWVSVGRLEGGNTSTRDNDLSPVQCICPEIASASRS